MSRILAIFLLCCSLCYGSQPQMDNELGLTKVYVAQDNLCFRDGCLLIVDGPHLLYVKTLHQDSQGLYYYYASLYGTCPRGHPYNADGGCTGYDCPFN